MSAGDITGVQAARMWLKDCYPDPQSWDEIDEATDEQIVRTVNREYEGGWDAFLVAEGLES